MLTRKKAAAELGISIRRLRDFEREGRLRPRGRKGHRRLYDEVELARFQKERGYIPKIKVAEPGKVPTYFVHGDDAARIFAMLNDGADLVSIVIELRIHPDAVEQTAERWRKLKKADRGLPVPTCAKCKQNSARFCGGCASAAADVA
jgi:hypothetical protein